MSGFGRTQDLFPNIVKHKELLNIQVRGTQALSESGKKYKTIFCGADFVTKRHSDMSQLYYR